MFQFHINKSPYASDIYVYFLSCTVCHSVTLWRTLWHTCQPVSWMLGVAVGSLRLQHVTAWRPTLDAVQTSTSAWTGDPTTFVQRNAQEVRKKIMLRILRNLIICH